MRAAESGQAGQTSTFFVGVAPPALLAEQVTDWQARQAHVVTAPHVTLKAPGRWNGSQLAACEEVCRRATPFEVRLGEVQTFPGRVIYLAAAGSGLHMLHADLVSAVGLPPGTFELADYHPHLTLALGWRPFDLGELGGAIGRQSVDGPEHWAAVLASAQAEFSALMAAPLSFVAREAVLFRKERAGEPYHEAARWPLQGEGQQGGVSRGD